MATIIKDLGVATAYGYAKSKGYTGTEEEFAELMASYATVAGQAAQSAEDAADSASAAHDSEVAAEAAQDKAEDAQGSAEAAAALLSDCSAEATTLSAGSAATAAYANGIFSFGIPKGDTGDTGYPTDAQVISGVGAWMEENPGATVDAVDAWLAAHPEATTTVEDGSITNAKLATSLKADIFAETFSTVADKELTATAGSSIGNSTSKSTVNLPAGTDILFCLSDPSGIVSKYYLYLDGSSDYAGYVPNRKIPMTLAANTTEIGIYVDSAWISASGTVEFTIEKVTKNTDSVEGRADREIARIVHASDGYVNGAVVANGSFRSAGTLTFDDAARIRTDFIRFKKGDKIVVENGSYTHQIGMWQGMPSAYTIKRNDSVDVSIDETIIPEYDGTVVITFAKSGDSDIFPSEFDGEIRLYNTLAWHNAVALGAADLPDYWLANNYLSDKAARINALGAAGDDVFVFITDIHWGLNAKRSPALIRFLSENCCIHKVFNGGDVSNVIDYAIYKKFAIAVDGQTHYVSGNHDWFAPNTGRHLYYAMDSVNNDQIGDPFMHYYYVDNPQLKIRYVTLAAFSRGDSSSDPLVTGFDATQIAWFENTALDLPAADWDVIVFVHYLGTDAYITGGSDIAAAMDAFNADSSHAGKILCVFQGHTHWDGIFHTTGGIPIITTTCDKWDLSNESDTVPAAGIAFRALGTLTEQAFDVVILNRAAKKFTCVRIGAPAQDNVDTSRTQAGFTWIGTLQEREVSYASE